MKKVLSLLLVLVLCLTAFAGCGGKGGKGSEKPIEETAEMTAARTAFEDGLRILYTSPNSYVFDQYVYKLVKGGSFEIRLTENLVDLEAGNVKFIKSETLFQEGDYTVYDVVFLGDLSTGERRLYHDVLITKDDGGVAKIVVQETLDEATQNALIARLAEFKGTMESFEKNAIDGFCKENKSFKSWYDKRKGSLKINTTLLCLSDTVQIPVSPKSSDNRQLVWSEEFENVTALTQTNMAQKTTTMSNDDIRLTRDDSHIRFNSDGTMTMISQPDPTGKKFYSMPDAVSTYEKMHFIGGYLELRARLPYQYGAWPSFWMKSMGEVTGADWFSEVDIFEVFGSGTQAVSAVHKWGKGVHTSKGCGNYTFSSNEEATDWHTYGLEWTQEYMKFYVDEICYYTLDLTTDYDDKIPGMDAYTDQLHYVILNNYVFTPAQENYAAMGFKPGNTAVVEYDVDYVRLYQNPEVDKIVIY